LCHWIPLDPHVLGSKTRGKKRLISYKIENRTSTMKKHYEVEHSNIFKTHVTEIVQWWRSTKTNAFVKQSSKVRKVVTPRFISAFF
jgi:hypothetical protein